MSEPVAYTYAGSTLCPVCALETTRVGFRLAGFGNPADMNEAIVIMALEQSMSGQPIDVPEPNDRPEADKCEGCNIAFIPQGSDAA